MKPRDRSALVSRFRIKKVNPFLMLSLFNDQDAKDDQHQTDEQTNNADEPFHNGYRIGKEYPDCIDAKGQENNPDK